MFPGKRSCDGLFHLVPMLCTGTHCPDAPRRCLPRKRRRALAMRSIVSGRSHAEHGNETRVSFHPLYAARASRASFTGTDTKYTPAAARTIADSGLSFTPSRTSSS